MMRTLTAVAFAAALTFGMALNTTNEPDLGQLPDVPDDADEAAAGAVVDDSFAETVDDDSPGAH